MVEIVSSIGCREENATTLPVASRLAPSLLANHGSRPAPPLTCWIDIDTVSKRKMSDRRLRSMLRPPQRRAHTRFDAFELKTT